MNVNLRDFRKTMADVINRVAYGDDRAVLTRHGKGVVAIVSMDDLALLERAEDDFWGEEGYKALKEMKRSGKKPIPLEEVERRLGLTPRRRRKAG